MKQTSCILWSVLFATVCSLTRARADSRTWEGSASSDWFDAGNWVENAVPVAGDHVTIATGTALLTNATPALASLTLTGTLVFSNWNTTLSATNVAIGSGGVMTHRQQSDVTGTVGVYADWTPDSRVQIVCSNLTIGASGAINTEGMVYQGLLNAPGRGPGGGSNYDDGAGHGGGGSNPSGLFCATYGSLTAPQDPGSGGGGHSTSAGGDGGGVVRIQAEGEVRIDGSINANGESLAGSKNRGGGSGGSIFVTCRTFRGSGRLSACGGGSAATVNGGAGGGRIAVVYDTAAQSALGEQPAAMLDVNRSVGYYNKVYYYGERGTLHLPPDGLLLQPVVTNLIGRLYGPAAWAPDSLLVKNAWLRFCEDGFALTVAEDLTVTGTDTALGVGGGECRMDGSAWRYHGTNANPVVTCRNLWVTNGGCLAVFSGVTNDPPELEAKVAVAEQAMIAGANSSFAPHAHPVTGASVLFSVRDLVITPGGAINADGTGYSSGWVAKTPGNGPGCGAFPTYSAGHGGAGGGVSNTYDSVTAPLLPGSGGYMYSASNPGGYGGGLVRIEAAGHVQVDGIVSANGEPGTGHGGKGSGGSVYIRCGTFGGTNSGANGIVRADGGSAAQNTAGGSGYGGGGGRIAVIWTNTAAQDALPAATVAFSARGGLPGDVLPGELGTLYFPDNRLLHADLLHSGVWSTPLSEWAPDRLALVDNWIRFPADGFRLAVTNDVMIRRISGTLGFSGVLELGGGLTWYRDRPYRVTPGKGPALTCANLILTNGARLVLYGGVTNGTDHGAQVDVAGDMTVWGGESWVNPWSHPTDGGSARFRVGNLVIPATNGGFNASELGYAGGNGAVPHKEGWGPGAGIYNAGNYGGGGYGGYGGGYAAGAGGGTYGSSNAPVDPGSGGFGHGNYGKAGGGLIRIEARRDMLVNGRLLANGGTRPGTGWGGSGSGGGIYLVCRRFLGSADGLLSARGGNMGELAGSGGGGGRIAVWRRRDLSDPAHPIPADVAPGTGTGTEGSLVWGTLPSPGTTLLVR